MAVSESRTQTYRPHPATALLLGGLLAGVAVAGGALPTAANAATGVKAGPGPGTTTAGACAAYVARTIGSRGCHVTVSGGRGVNYSIAPTGEILYNYPKGTKHPQNGILPLYFTPDPGYVIAYYDNAARPACFRIVSDSTSSSGPAAVDVTKQVYYLLPKVLRGAPFGFCSNGAVSSVAPRVSGKSISAAGNAMAPVALDVSHLSSRAAQGSVASIAPQTNKVLVILGNARNTPVTVSEILAVPSSTHPANGSVVYSHVANAVTDRSGAVVDTINVTYVPAKVTQATLTIGVTNNRNHKTITSVLYVTLMKK